MGSQSNADAIPVAVRSLPTPPKKGHKESKIVEDSPLFRLIEWEGFNNALSQKTCHIIQITFSFRVKGMRCKSRWTFIFLSLFSRKQSQTKNHVK